LFETISKISSIQLSILAAEGGGQAVRPSTFEKPPGRRGPHAGRRVLCVNRDGNVISAMMFHLSHHHLTPDDLGAMAVKAGVKKLVVTHLVPAG